LQFSPFMRHSGAVFGQLYIRRFADYLSEAPVAPTHFLPFVSLQVGVSNYRLAVPFNRSSRSNLLLRDSIPAYARSSAQIFVEPRIGLDIGLTENLNLTFTSGLRFFVGQPDSLLVNLIPQIGLTYGIGNRPKRTSPKQKLTSEPSIQPFRNIRLTTNYTYILDPRARDRENGTLHNFQEHVFNLRLGTALSPVLRVGLHGMWIHSRWDGAGEDYFAAGVYSQFYFLRKIFQPYLGDTRPYIEWGLYGTDYCSCDPGQPYREFLFQMAWGGGVELPIHEFVGLKLGATFYEPLTNRPLAYNTFQYVAGLTWDLRK
ncbi:MAG: hypothetical protein AAFR59_17850, partial [Bacteroidota bacterium]